MNRSIAAGAAVLLIGLASITPSSPAGAEETLDRCNVAGTWRGVGLDVAHTRWTFVLTLTQRQAAVSGAFEWRGSNGDDGTERVEGRVDCRAQRIAMHGVALEHAPALALGQYTMAFDTRFTSFDGRWTGGIDGTFHGTR